MAEWDLDTPPDRPSAKEEIAVSSRQAGEPAAAPSRPDAGAGESRNGSKRRVWSKYPAWIVAGLLLVLVGALAGFFIARSQWASDSAELVEVREELAAVRSALTLAEERNWMYYRKTEALTAQLEEALAGGATTTSTTMPGPVAAGTFGDGVYLVGEDIQPGVYDGAVTGEAGYWARLKATDGMVSSIVANGLPRGPFVLTIVESDRAVELRGVVITAR